MVHYSTIVLDFINSANGSSCMSSFLVSISHVFFLNLFLGIPSCPGGCMTFKEKIQQRGEIEAEKDIIAGHELPDTKIVKSKTTVYDSPLHGGEMKL